MSAVKFSAIAARAKSDWSDDARAVYEAAVKVFEAEAATGVDRVEPPSPTSRT